MNPHIQAADRALAVRYLTQPRQLTPDERLRALGLFDALGASAVTVGNQTTSFAAFYKAHVEEKYATPFFDRLLAAEDAPSAGNQLLRETWQQIVRDLRDVGVQLAGDMGQQCLVAFCGYWWQAFGKGYIREVVFRDLERSGIEFTAHDLRDASARFSGRRAVSGYGGAERRRGKHWKCYALRT